MKIIKLPPDRWKDYKNLRLNAVQENPEAFGQTYDELSLRSDDDWKMQLERSADGLKRWVVFAESNGELVGMVSATAMKTLQEGVKVREMFVVPAVRGKGVATELMKGLEAELNNTNKTVLRLGVFNTQTEAVNLYKNLGFEVVEEKTEHFPNGLSHQSLIMEKKLINNE